MTKQAGTRNQRYKGFKVKHFLQICVFLGLSIWLLYQFRDNKGIGIVQNVMSDQHGAIKLGRKDLDPRQPSENNETGDVEAEEEIKGEEIEDDRGGSDRDKAVGEEIEEVEDLIDEEDTEFNDEQRGN